MEMNKNDPLPLFSIGTFWNIFIQIPKFSKKIQVIFLYFTGFKTLTSTRNSRVHEQKNQWSLRKSWTKWTKSPHVDLQWDPYDLRFRDSANPTWPSRVSNTQPTLRWNGGPGFHMAVSKNRGVFTSQIHPFVQRVWNHYFHHPFWGPPLFLETPIFLGIQSIPNLRFGGVWMSRASRRRSRSNERFRKDSPWNSILIASDIVPI